MVRSAGTSCILTEKDLSTNYAVLKMPSKEERRFLLDCMATIGVVSNSEHKFIKLGKAGDRVGSVADRQFVVLP